MNTGMQKISDFSSQLKTKGSAQIIKVKMHLKLKMFRTMSVTDDTISLNIKVCDPEEVLA